MQALVKEKVKVGSSVKTRRCKYMKGTKMSVGFPPAKQNFYDGKAESMRHQQGVELYIGRFKAKTSPGFFSSAFGPGFVALVSATVLTFFTCLPHWNNIFCPSVWRGHMLLTLQVPLIQEQFSSATSLYLVAAEIYDIASASASRVNTDRGSRVDSTHDAGHTIRRGKLGTTGQPATGDLSTNMLPQGGQQPKAAENNSRKAGDIYEWSFLEQSLQQRKELGMPMEEKAYGARNNALLKTNLPESFYSMLRSNGRKAGHRDSGLLQESASQKSKLELGDERCTEAASDIHESRDQLRQSVLEKRQGLPVHPHQFPRHKRSVTQINFQQRRQKEGQAKSETQPRQHPLLFANGRTPQQKLEQQHQGAEVEAPRQPHSLGAAQPTEQPITRKSLLPPSLLESGQKQQQERDEQLETDGKVQRRHQLSKLADKLKTIRRPVHPVSMGECACRRHMQAIVTVDGGSSKTLASVFSLVTDSCTEGRIGRRVLDDSLSLIGSTSPSPGLRSVLEKWLITAKGSNTAWDLTSLNVSLAEQRIRQVQLLRENFNELRQEAEELVNKVLNDAVSLLVRVVPDNKLDEIKALGVPVILHSTAGLRGFPDLYTEGLFIALREAINSFLPNQGFSFFTNTKFAQPISGHREGVYAFLTLNYLLGNLRRLRLVQAVQQAIRDPLLEKVLLKLFLCESFTQDLPANIVELREFLASAGDLNCYSSSKTEGDTLNCSAEKGLQLSTFDGRRCLGQALGDNLLHFGAHRYLEGIVEMGGASLQIAFPVQRLELPPPFRYLRSLQKGGYLSSVDYPPVDLMAVSFMLLGASNAGGLLLKTLCAAPPFLRNGLCSNPCLLQNFSQPCSAGEVLISENGVISVRREETRNRLWPAANFCAVENAQVRYKRSMEMQCTALKLDPQSPLEERLKIPNCSTVVGVGNFHACLAATKKTLIDPQLPLPANQEAAAVGVETLTQLFQFYSSSAPLYFSGNALVKPLELLQELKLLPPGHLRFAEKDVEKLEQAASTFCALPVVKGDNGELRIVVQATTTIESGLHGSVLENAAVTEFHKAENTQASAGYAKLFSFDAKSKAAVRSSSEGVGPVATSADLSVKLDSYNYENCLKLAVAVSLLKLVYVGANKPSQVIFDSVVPLRQQQNQQKSDQQQLHRKGNPLKKGEKQDGDNMFGTLGWQMGAAIHRITRAEEWRQLVYEVGPAHALPDKISRRERQMMQHHATEKDL